MNRLPISVVITSIAQREIALRTCHYFLNICTEVIFVDEEKPILEKMEIMARPPGFVYLQYASSELVQKPVSVIVTEKIAMGCARASNQYVIRANHDEIYSAKGLEAALEYLDSHQDFAFVSGQCVGFHYDRNKTCLAFARKYKGLSGYENVFSIGDRFLYQSVNYVPIAHYALWRKEFLGPALHLTTRAHEAISQTVFCDELVFEMIAMKYGKSRSLPELFWIRNRCNGISYTGRDFANDSYLTLRRKLCFSLPEINDEQLDLMIESFEERWPIIKFSKARKALLLIRSKFAIRSRYKKIKDLLSWVVGRIRLRPQCQPNNPNPLTLNVELESFLKTEKISYSQEDVSGIVGFCRLWEPR
jgi:hypothetical protein